MQSLAEQIAAWMRDQIDAADARGLIVGLSGGINSTVVAGLCRLAAPGASAAVLLPCQSDSQDESDARLAADQFQLPALTVNLDAVYDVLGHTLRAASAEWPGGVAPPDETSSRALLSTTKPRLRMMVLSFLAARLGYLVAGTADKGELSLGRYAKYGDGLGDLLPLGDLLKSQVRALAQALDVPAAIVGKPPSPGIWPRSQDGADTDLTDADLEKYLAGGPETVAPALALRIERLVRASGRRWSHIPICEIKP